MHLAHPLPQQVYLLMHTVIHPLNTVVGRLILTAPLFLPRFLHRGVVRCHPRGRPAGFRVGWFNYFLIDTELHRYQHSADPAEAKNYAAVVTVWDRLFGTFDVVALIKAVQTLERNVNVALMYSGFRVPQCWLLDTLAGMEHATVSELGEKLRITRATTSVMVNELIQSASVMMIENPSDRRCLLYPSVQSRPL